MIEIVPATYALLDRFYAGKVPRTMRALVVVADGVPVAVAGLYADQGRQVIFSDGRAEQIRDAAMTRVWYGLRRAGFSIPFPQRDVTLRTLTEDHEARAQERLRRDVFAVLRQVPLFAPLSDAEIGQLAGSASLERFTAGEVLVRQGEAGDSLFVVKSGRARVEVRLESGPVLRVATRGANEFFGEMSLLTGEPRSASVIAEAETEVVVVEKADFAAVVTADTGILEALSVALEESVRNLAEHSAALDAAAEKRPPQRGALLQRIRGFFGIRAP